MFCARFRVAFTTKIIYIAFLWTFKKQTSKQLTLVMSYSSYSRPIVCGKVAFFVEEAIVEKI